LSAESQAPVAAPAAAAGVSQQPLTLDELEKEINRICHAGDDENVAIAADMLENFTFDDDDDMASEAVQKVMACYSPILNALAMTEREKIPDAARRASRLLDKLFALNTIAEWKPLNIIDVLCLTIKVWVATPSEEGASVECQSRLEKFWTWYSRRPNEQQQLTDKESSSLKECYYHAIRACSMRDRGAGAAKQAEALMEEMESRCIEFRSLAPDRRIVNEVMNAWSKSGLTYRAGTKCELLLNQMVEMAEDGGRPEMAPDSASFNIAISALAQGKEKVPGTRAEALLYLMEELCSRHGWNCAPDQTSFNSVINNWASKRSPSATERTIDILEHMRKRAKAGITSVQPDGITYSVVLKSLARSNDPDAITTAERMFEQYLDDVQNQDWDIHQYSLTWNSMINCYAKSKLPDAGQKALDLFETMKANAGKPGWENCFVDVYTYTTVIDAIAKEETYEGSKMAVSLLEELEKSYEETGERRFQPNILLYTAAVNAIGRSHKEPERAQAIVDRVESSFLESSTTWKTKPDVLFYNALINAYGWSDMNGKSKKCAEVLQHMIDLAESRKLPNARPDIISFNSVLNACAYEKPDTQASTSEILEIATETYERLSSGKGEQSFGRPDLSTYIQMMINIINHIPRHDERRELMAEAVFFRCAEDGLVGPAIVSKLAFALSKPRFQSIMGEALDKEKHNEGKLVFDVSLLPQAWTAKLPWLQRGRPPSRGRRLKSNYQVTKNTLTGK
jgi:pentatricopeptide repeat protein